MGMDLYAVKPESPKGEYFRANVWYWRPLWNYTCDTCDDILSKEDMLQGEYNDGYEINAEKAFLISERLEELFKSNHAHENKKYYNELSDDHTFDPDFVMEFAKFCGDSGGFNIY